MFGIYGRCIAPCLHRQAIPTGISPERNGLCLEATAAIEVETTNAASLPHGLHVIDGFWYFICRDNSEQDRSTLSGPHPFR